MEFTLLWAALTAVAAMWVGLRLWPERVPDSAFDALLGSAAAGLLGGRVTAMALQGINPITNLGDLIIVRGGVNTPAAVVFAVVTLFLMTGKHLRSLDALAPTALLGLAGWHLGCLWRGACLGTASSLPWAWSEAGSTITRHPVEIYAALGMLGAAVAVSRLPWTVGVRGGSALALASAVRLMTEPFRLSLTGGPTAWYIAGIAAGLAIALIGSRRDPNPT